MADYDPRTVTGIPTEPVGSLPRPSRLQEAYAQYDAGQINREQLEAEQDTAVRDSIEHLEATGEPIISDGEQRWSSFATYAIADTLAGTGLADHLAGGGGQYFAIFADGHKRQLPKLTGGPFRYKTYAADTLKKSITMAHSPMKQAVIAPSMLALLYPLDEEIPGYTREQFEADLVDECEKDIRQAFAAGAARVSVDFTEGRLATRNDPRNPWTGRNMLPHFHRAQQPGDGPVHGRGTKQDRRPYVPGRRPRLGAQRGRALQRPAAFDVRHQRGILPHPAVQRAGQGPGLQDDWREPPRRRERRGFSPFSIDEKPSHGSPEFARETAWQKITNRVQGTKLAAEKLGLG
jgi:hypothetical protein